MVSLLNDTLMIERSANEMRIDSSMSTNDSHPPAVLECSEGLMLHYLLHSYIVEPEWRKYLLNGL